MAPTMAAAEGNELVRKSSKRNVDGVLREGSNLSDAAGEGTTGLTNYVGDANLDWEAPANAEEIAPKTRTLSFRKVLRTSSFRKKEKEQVGFVSLLRDSTVHGLLHLPPVSLCDHVRLPKNWSRVTEKDGTVYYVNTVSNRRSVEIPAELPSGWVEGIDKESGRVCFTNKSLKKTVFELPTESSEQRQADGDDENANKDSLFGRTVSLFGGRKAAKKGEGEASDRQSSFRRRSIDTKTETTGQSQRTVFISCSALIRETKLCVGPEMQDALDRLLATLAAREVLAEVAVKQLMELVGSTIVQQAGLSVMNAQKGILPHGWLEYVDDASGRPYYYNVRARAISTTHALHYPAACRWLTASALACRYTLVRQLGTSPSRQQPRLSWDLRVVRILTASSI
eukprot:scaffold40242_cov35-Tisochrysis_lutea.AAC.1